VVRDGSPEPTEVVERAPAPARRLRIGAIDRPTESVEAAVRDEGRGVAGVATDRLGLVDDRHRVVGHALVGRERPKRRADVVGHGEGWPRLPC